MSVYYGEQWIWTVNYGKSKIQEIYLFLDSSALKALALFLTVAHSSLFFALEEMFIPRLLILDHWNLILNKGKT